MNNLEQEIIADVQRAEQKTENVVEQLLNWEKWEVLTHLAVVILFIVVIYMLATSPDQRSLTNLLLLLIALGVAVQIHQNINIKRTMQN